MLPQDSTYLPSSNQRWHWKIPHMDNFPSYKPLFIGDFQLPRLIARGFWCYMHVSWVQWGAQLPNNPIPDGVQATSMPCCIATSPRWTTIVVCPLPFVPICLTLASLDVWFTAWPSNFSICIDSSNFSICNWVNTPCCTLLDSSSGARNYDLVKFCRWRDNSHTQTHTCRFWICMHTYTHIYIYIYMYIYYAKHT